MEVLHWTADITLDFAQRLGISTGATISLGRRSLMTVAPDGHATHAEDTEGISRGRAKELCGFVAFHRNRNRALGTRGGAGHRIESTKKQKIIFLMNPRRPSIAWHLPSL
jgi:hypothetical protein